MPHGIANRTSVHIQWFVVVDSTRGEARRLGKGKAMAEEFTIDPRVAFVLPTGILNVDADIIDDQENHIVLTLRVSKEMIRSNRALLSALIEMAVAPEKVDHDDA
jgi:hypothetical protein